MKAIDNAPQAAAIITYDGIHSSLIADARRAEADRRPLTARRIRYYATLVARAADAEERDPRPQR